MGEKEKPGRPKTLVRRHILEVKADTREWLSEEFDELKSAFLAGKGIGALGEASEGLLSNPLLLVGVVGAVVAGAVGADAGEKFLEYFGKLEIILNPESTRAQKTEAAHDAALLLRSLLKLFPFGGGLVP